MTRCLPADRRALVMRKLKSEHGLLSCRVRSQELRVLACVTISTTMAFAWVAGQQASVDIERMAGVRSEPLQQERWLTWDVSRG